MKVYHKALVAAGLCICMALGMTGCGSEPLDGSQVVATVGEKEMTLGEANFLLRYQQAQTETYYKSLVGDDLYDMDLSGSGTTFGQSMKDDVMTQLQEYYILEEKAADYAVALTDEETAKITETAAAFLEANGKDVKEQMTADQATVERVLTLMTIRSKVASAIREEANITVTDEEAAQRGFSYVTVNKGSGDEALTDEEIQENKDKLAAIAEKVNGGDTIDAAAVEQGLTAYTSNYGNGYTAYFDDAVITALDALKEGEVSDVIETDTELYLVQVTADFDEEATQTRKESMISTAETEYYTSLMDTWKTEIPLTVEESVWEQVVFDRSYETVSE